MDADKEMGFGRVAVSTARDSKASEQYIHYKRAQDYVKHFLAVASSVSAPDFFDKTEDWRKLK